MRLPPKNGSGSSATRNRPPTVSTSTSTNTNTNVGTTSTNTSLQELVAASFDTLEDNINDIIAFEEVAEKKNDEFDRARKMIATPSERYVMPSPRVPSKTVMPSSPSPVQEAKKRLSLSSEYSSSSRKSPGAIVPKKRTSFTSDSSWMKPSKDSNNDDGEVIKPSSIRRASATSVASASDPQQPNNGDKKQVPSNKLFKKPSERALRELKELSTKFDSDMEITELRQELHRASINYEVLSKKSPFGIDSSAERNDLGGDNTAKRISFQKDLPQTFNENDVHGAIKERLEFFRTSLQEYTEEQHQQQQQQQQQLQEEISESETDDTSKDQHLSREINTKRPSGASLEASLHAEKRLSDVTLDTAIGIEKRPGHVVTTVEDADDDHHHDDDNDHDDNLKVAKEMIYGDGGKSMQTTPTASGNSEKDKDFEVEEKKRKFGESLGRFFSALKSWFQKRIEAFVASFTPKEKMIYVNQMG
ncbi:unnamed protein product [Cylindrotheca closterium]|uniref:Uncharacterized protein n=1 Tax=Cylindrotheca closterium TaxID=2856 RepID=A0AAD2CH28_9STRA|nr:unnamed protein product [Cylindrotheca closterium]